MATPHACYKTWAVMTDLRCHNMFISLFRLYGTIYVYFVLYMCVCGHKYAYLYLCLDLTLIATSLVRAF